MSYDAEELDLYAWNTGELYPARKRIIAKMRERIADGTYKAELAWRQWLLWYDEAARRYVREIDASARFSRSERVKAAKERAKEEHNKIKRGEYD